MTLRKIIITLIIVGGLIGGWIHAHYGLGGVFLFGGAAATVWLLAASGMASPSYHSSYLLKVGSMDEAQAAELQADLMDIEGVGDAVVAAEEGVAYLKVDTRVVDESVLEAYSRAEQ